MTNYEKIKNMSVEEMAKFIRKLVADDELSEVGCYNCICYGTHHSDIANKGTYLYECEGCDNEGVGLDLIKWLNLEAKQ